MLLDETLVRVTFSASDGLPSMLIARLFVLLTLPADTVNDPATAVRSIPSSLLLVVVRLCNVTASVPVATSMPPPVALLTITSLTVSVPTLLPARPEPLALPAVRPRTKLLAASAMPSPPLF